MASRRGFPVQPDYSAGRPAPAGGPLDSPRSSGFPDTTRVPHDNMPYTSSSAPYPSTLAMAGFRSTVPIIAGPSTTRTDSTCPPGYSYGPSAAPYGPSGSSYGSFSNHNLQWEPQGRVSPDMHFDEFGSPSSPLDYAFDASSKASGKARGDGKGHPQRRSSNRDEFDGPNQYLQRPTPEYIALQDRDLPHLPTNLVVQEQDSVLAQVNDILSQSAFDFVAKYQFPIPLDTSCRPVQRPQDREWTEWVLLLKRLATKRRIPARVLYNGQIKQLVTILENSLEMRHAAKHQSRPLKDDRNILQLISAGIQVARILKDATAFDALDRLYVMTETQIQERTGNRFR